MSSSADDLVAFYAARLDEVERVAQAASDETGNPTWTYTGDYVMAEHPGYPGGREYVAIAPWDGDVSEGVGRHISCHDPARTLRRVAAGRKLIELCGKQWTHDLRGTDGGLEMALELAVNEWDDHDDFNPRWKL